MTLTQPPAREAPGDGRPPSATTPVPPRPLTPPSGRRPRGRRRWVIVGLVLLVILAVALAVRTATAPAAAPAPTPEPVGPRLTAHGSLRPLNQARVGTLAGGVVTRLAVDVGNPVEAQQELARVRGPNGEEILTAPFRGTVTSLPAHLGDTVTPGTVVATVGDLSRLLVETTDVDEYLVGHAKAGQQVQLSIEAVDGREMTGRVRTVAVQPETNATGDRHYPVVIDPTGPVNDLRPGMSVRVTFLE